MTKKSLETENRLSTLEANYKSLNDKVIEIAENHLVHLAEDIKEVQKSVNSINVKLALYAGGIIAGVWIVEKFLIK